MARRSTASVSDNHHGGVCRTWMGMRRNSDNATPQVSSPHLHMLTVSCSCCCTNPSFPDAIVENQRHCGNIESLVGADAKINLSSMLTPFSLPCQLCIWRIFYFVTCHKSMVHGHESWVRRCHKCSSGEKKLRRTFLVLVHCTAQHCLSTPKSCEVQLALLKACGSAIGTHLKSHSLRVSIVKQCRHHLTL